MSKDDIIFDLTRKDWKYKGVFFGRIDNEVVEKKCNFSFPITSFMRNSYFVGIMAIIYMDENSKWNLVARIKFPSGKKQVIRKCFSTPEDSNKNINETYCLQFLYKFPIINKIWKNNPSGEGEGILKILINLDMIKSCRIMTN